MTDERPSMHVAFPQVDLSTFEHIWLRVGAGEPLSL